MISWIRRRLTYANVLVTAVAFLMLAGTSVAATLVTGKQIKNGTITGKDVKNHSLTRKDFKGSVRGPQGVPGSSGDPGHPGTEGRYGRPRRDERRHLHRHEELDVELFGRRVLPGRCACRRGWCAGLPGLRVPRLQPPCGVKTHVGVSDVAQAPTNGQTPDSWHADVSQESGFSGTVSVTAYVICGRALS